MMETFKTFKFHGGIHPSDGKKLTDSKPLRIAPLFEQYIVPLQQSIGAPTKPVVQPGDSVGKGQKIAEAGGFVSAPVHSPVNGRIKEFTESVSATGVPVQTAVIIPEGDDEWHSGLEPLEQWRDADPAVLKQRIADCGIVGMGGAAFPTVVKLSPPPEKDIDTLIVNAAECEPYLTADHRLLLDRPEAVLTGASIAAKILKISRIFIGIEENKPDAIEKLSGLAGKYKVKVVPLRVRYPQGAEKQLIYALTGRKIIEGGLPMDVGCVVQNAGTCAAIADAVTLGHPLIERFVTVTGSPVADPCNLLLRIGTPASRAIELCGGVTEQPAKLIFGGPMMGFTQAGIETPVCKNTSGILLLSADEISQYQGNPCIHCGRCIDVCPMNLLIPSISTMVEAERIDLAEKNFVMDCIECGSCAFVCPASRPLVQLFRRAKAEINARRRRK